MQLNGTRITLAPLNDSDLALFIEMSMSPVMMEHVYEPFSLQEAHAAFLAKSKPWTISSDCWLVMGITETLTNEKLGNIGFKIINHEAKIAEVGFMIKAGAQGKGFAGEALSLIKTYALAELGLNKLVATCSVNNVGSYKLLEKQGFIREELLGQNTLINGQYVDDYMYGLCKPA